MLPEIGLQGYVKVALADFGPWTLDFGHLHGICGQSTPAGIGKVQPETSWSVFFGDGGQAMTFFASKVDISATYYKSQELQA